MLQLSLKGYNPIKEAATGKCFTKIGVLQKAFLQYHCSTRVLKVL